MSERYVKEILEKLEEIEKLHAKLRSMVPRVKNYELENSSNDARKGSINMEKKQSVAKETNGNKENYTEQKPVDSHRGSQIIKNTFRNSTTRIKKLFDPNAKSMRYLRKFKDRTSSKWRKFRGNSINFVSQQWKDKNDTIKHFLSAMNEPDIILVSRASQTSDDLENIVSKMKSTVFNSRKKQSLEERRSTLQDLSERLLEHFNYLYDSNPVNESTVSMHDHALGKDEPHRVRKTLLVPDEKTETLKIVSSARKISVTDNRKRSSSGTRSNKLSRVYTDVRSMQ